MGQANTTSEFNIKKKNNSYLHADSNSMEIAIEKGERERRLENMVRKTNIPSHHCIDTFMCY